MREQKTKTRVKKNNYKIIPTRIPPPTPRHKLTTPHLSHPPIIYNSNTVDIEFQIQMKQSNKCGSVRNDEILNLHLGSGEGP